MVDGSEQKIPTNGIMKVKEVNWSLWEVKVIKNIDRIREIVFK